MLGFAALTPTYVIQKKEKRGQYLFYMYDRVVDQ